MFSGSILNCGDTVIALEAHRGDAVLDSRPSASAAPFADKDVAGAIDHLHHAEILDRRGALLGVVHHLAEEPEAGVGDADEIPARISEA